MEPKDQSGRVRIWGAILLAVSLVVLWWRLLDHLWVEWAVNPQYHYGFAVPFACAYLILRNFRDQEGSRGKPANPGGTASIVTRLAVLVLAVAYLPIRLVQEANPEWRLVSWALAAIVVGITLVLAWSLDGSVGPGHVSWFQLVSFPAVFFLVAVPWPTMIEGPLMRDLARLNATLSVEALASIGIPALMQGNVIEVGTGVVGIDEACSGIRSLQATLVVAFFMGELYGLVVVRRLILCGIGLALAVILNLLRTALLAGMAARTGAGAVEAWHDSVGAAILVGCFLLIWAIAVVLRQTPRIDEGKERPYRRWRLGRPTFTEMKRCPGIAAYGALAVWLVCSEVGTELWYRAHEVSVSQRTSWSVELPRGNPTFKELLISQRSHQYLRFDEGASGTWQEAGGGRVQAIYLRWKPGRTAANLARSHTPDICLPATGKRLLASSGEQRVQVKGLELAFRGYVVEETDGRGLVHVFYCLWEDSNQQENFETAEMDCANRLWSVAAGRRNRGQRSLELIFWGLNGQEEARLALNREVGRVLVAIRTPRRLKHVAGRTGANQPPTLSGGSSQMQGARAQ